MNIRFDNKVVVVTGSSSGIGKATAIEFAKAGADVVIHYNSNVRGAEDVASEIEETGQRSVVIRGDLSQKVHVDNLVKETMRAFGSIDILVNNAGTLVERKPIETMDEQLWDRVMEVNLKSVFLCSNAVIPIMKENGFGRIINVTSIAARNGGGPGAGHYSSAKAGVLTFTKSLAKELAGTGILVNCVSPGVISTPYHDAYSTAESRKMFADNTPLKREGTPEEVACPILFLASEYASFILGETLEINGGMLMD